MLNGGHSRGQGRDLNKLLPTREKHNYTKTMIECTVFMWGVISMYR